MGAKLRRGSASVLSLILLEQREIIIMTSLPHLTYAPIAGRAELIRLIAAAGGVPITQSASLADFGKSEIQETSESKKNYMSPSGMPLLSHGNLKMSQSGAIEGYIASIAPRYQDLTAQQRAVDAMYCGIKEEMLLNCAKAVFTTRKTNEEQARQDVTTLLDKWFVIFEDQLPDDGGFVLKQPFPTCADLALLNITTAFMPFGAAIKMIGGYDFAKWGKVKALCDRTAADPEVAKYLAEDTYTTANPFGL